MLAEKLAALPIDFRPSKRRKTLGLKVAPGRVIVAYPVWAKQAEVYQWLNEKADWICQHYVPAPKVSEPEPLQLGSLIWWRGERVACSKLFPDGHEFYTRTLPEQKGQVLEACQALLQLNIGARVAHFEQALGFTAKALKLRPYKSRWGSCDHKGLVALNSLLAMAPDWVVDYVIIHELCHLKHPNHAPAFWAEVRRGCPAQQITNAKRWLRQHGEELLQFYR